MERKIYYLDHAATTPISPEVYKKMLECYAKCQGNNSSIYAMGRQAAAELEAADLATGMVSPLLLPKYARHEREENK